MLAPLCRPFSCCEVRWLEWWSPVTSAAMLCDQIRRDLLPFLGCRALTTDFINRLLRQSSR